MEFTLFYTGIIKSGNSADITNKNDIRVKIHEQLTTLRNHPPLNSRKDLFDKNAYPDFHTNVKGFDYFSLVSGKWNMYVELSLNVLIPHNSLSFGDIDNKLKTLFDALRPPRNENEIPKSWIPNSTQKPLLCLLEDDELIYKVNIDTDYLLDTTLTKPGEIMVIMYVKVKGNSGQIGILDLII
jgi:hypothetical protein